MSRCGVVFGFWGFFDRVAAILAPAGNLLLLYLFDEKLEFGIAYFLSCFVISFFMLGRVDEERGRACAT